MSVSTMASSASNPPSREIAIFWDYENVPLPDGCNASDVSKCINNAVSKYGRIVDRRLYSDSRKFNVGLNSANRRFLDSYGFDLVDTPSKGTKETLDKKMIADILTFAWDSSVRNSAESKPCVVLVTSDGDYAYTLSKLRDRGVMSVVFFGRACTVAQVLVENADVALSLEKDVLAPIAASCDASAVSSSTVSRTSADGDDVAPGSSYPLSSVGEGGESLDSFNMSQTRLRQRPLPTDDLELFCVCVHNVQQLARKKSSYGGSSSGTSLSDYWATDLHVGGYFKKSMSNAGEGDRNRAFSDKQRYQNVRARAIGENLVQAGRRVLNSAFRRKDIVGVTWDENAGKREGLSTEVYLRLAPYGISKVESFFKGTEVGSHGSFMRFPSTSPEKPGVSSARKLPQEAFGEERSSSFHEDKWKDNTGITSSYQDESRKVKTLNTGDTSVLMNWLSLFCYCVRDVQQIMAAKASGIPSWATDACVAESFRKYATKDLYKDVRELAIKNGLVDVGRRYCRGSGYGKDIREVQWCENAGKCEGLSDEFYLRLTGIGVSFSKKKLPDDFITEHVSRVEPTRHGDIAPTTDVITEPNDSSVCFSTSDNLDLGSIIKRKPPQSIVSTGESESTRVPPWGRPQVERSSEPNVMGAVSPEEGALVLFRSVKKMQMLAARNSGTSDSNPWITDSSVSASFRSEALWNSRNIRVTAKDYKAARDSAISEGLVEAGRRKVKSYGSGKDIVKISWQDNAGKRDGLASEVYLRLSQGWPERNVPTLSGLSMFNKSNDLSTRGQEDEAIPLPPLDRDRTKPVSVGTFPVPAEVSSPFATPSRESAASSSFQDGQEALYTDLRGGSIRVRILKTHYEDAKPFYTILLPSGTEMQTDDAHLCDVDDQYSQRRRLFADSTKPLGSDPVKNANEDFAYDDGGELESSTFMLRGLVGQEESVTVDEYEEITKLNVDITEANPPVAEVNVKDDTVTSFQTSWSGRANLLDTVTDTLSSNTVSNETGPSQVLSSLSESDASDANDSVAFLACITKAHLLVMKKGTTANFWATDSAVAGLFFEEIASNAGTSVNRPVVKMRYKKVRDETIKRGWVEAGRRRLDLDERVKQIDTISWNEVGEKPINLSPELYLRLTESGGSVVASSQDINLS